VVGGGAPCPSVHVARAGDVIFIPFNHWHLVLSSSAGPAEAGAKEEAAEEEEEEAVLAVNFWVTPRNKTEARGMRPRVFPAEQARWRDSRTKEGNDGGPPANPCAAGAGAAAGAFANALAQHRRLARALQVTPQCTVLGRDEPAAAFYPEFLDFKFASTSARGGGGGGGGSGGGSGAGPAAAATHAGSGLRLNMHGYAQGEAVEDLPRFSAEMRSAYAMCECQLEDLRGRGSLAGTARRGDKRTAYKAMTWRLEALELCTGRGSGRGFPGGGSGGGSQRVLVPDAVVEAAMEGRLLHVNLWMSRGAGTSSGLHFDHYENHLVRRGALHLHPACATVINLSFTCHEVVITCYLRPRLVSALEAEITLNRFQTLLSISTCACTAW